MRSVSSKQNPVREPPPGARPPLHPLESALLAVTGLHLCFLPWALGTMHLWSQLTSLAFSSVGFLLTLFPRHENGGWSSGKAAGASPAGRLLRLPVFWGGLLVLGYVAVQGCNPAWRYVSNADSWWLEPVAHIGWLPSGIAVPFELSGPGRALVVYSSLWLLVCSVAVGFLRRHSYRVLFTVLALNALGLTLLGLLQIATGAKRIFWFYLPSNAFFASSFIYPNHTGAYLNLMVALATGLALWSYHRGRLGLEKPGAARGLAVVAAGAALMVVLSNSRTSIIMLLAFTVVSGAALAFRFFRRKNRDPAELLPLALMFAGFLAIGLVTLNSAKAWNRFTELLDDPMLAARGRWMVRQAAVDMFSDRWLLGWGAGGFRHGFPLYAQKHPEIYREGAQHWEHAHNDLVEFPVELGVLGLLPTAGTLLHGAWQLARRRFWRNAMAFPLVLGCGLVFLHAWVDFVFQCPAVLLTWGVLLMGTLRWIELDNPPQPKAG